MLLRSSLLRIPLKNPFIGYSKTQKKLKKKTQKTTGFEVLFEEFWK